MSAVTGQGVPALLLRVNELLQEGWQTLQVQVNAADGRRLAWLHAHGEVLNQALHEDSWTLTVKLRASDAAAWEKL